MHRLLSTLPFLLIATFCTLSAHTPATAEEIFESEIEFANPAGEHLKLDLARPDGKGPYPAVICIHGGGFREGDQSYYDGLIQELAAKGYVAATINYRLAPKHPFPAAVHDCKAAVRWLRANADKYHVDPAHVGVVGSSAGGTLALFLGATAGKKQFEGEGPHLDQSSAVQCVVSFFGPSDFMKWYGNSPDAEGVLQDYLGGNPKTQPKRHADASPLTHISPKSAPTLCIHGTKDELVPLEQSQWMVDALKKAGVQTNLLVVQNAGHGFEGNDDTKANAAAIEFLDKHLKTNPRPKK